MNTSTGWKDLPPSSVEYSPTNRRDLRFRPLEGESDFGSVVACWAVNDVGWQKDPCVFRISLAGNSLSLCFSLSR